MNKIFIVSSIFFYTFSQLNIYDYNLSYLFAEDPVHTEYTAYNLLKNNSSYFDKEINYLAVPWSVLINKNKLALVPRMKLNGGFAICQHIYFEKIIPILKEIGIDTLFTPHVTKKYEGINVLPFPHLAINIPSNNCKKDIYTSFIGATNTHITRKKIVEMFHPFNAYIKERTSWHWSSYFNKLHGKPIRNDHKQVEESNKIEYIDTLARSRFSFCPRGTGASTIRFWESLASGAIPVLISDEMMLPEYIKWEDVIVRIKESDIDEVYDILKNITPEREEVMRKNCYNVYKSFSGNNFISPIIENYKK